jgi:isochorismate synthase
MNSKGFCYYRLPSEQSIWLMEGVVKPFDHAGIPEEGFVLAPFAGDSAWVLPAMAKEVKTVDASKTIYTRPVDAIPTEGKEETLERIKASIALTEQGRLKKVVAAKAKWISNPLKLNLFELFNILCREYPDAFVYLWSSPETGTWLGASPEMLFRQSGNQAKTVALAGTRKNAAGCSFENKEIAEQQWVLKFLVESLEQLGCSNIEAGQLTEKNAGHLMHLNTGVNFTLTEDVDRWNIIRTLHPTPAVSGYPQKESIAFINRLEQFDRSFYSGYLGPFGLSNSDIFVNLRCLHYFKEGVLLYAGAGITEDSVPEDEWSEMEEKLATLGRWL